MDTANDRLSLAVADDTQSDFNSGTLTDTTADDNPGFLQLKTGGSGVSSANAALNKSVSIGAGSSQQVGLESYLTDGELSNAFGFTASGNFSVSLGSAKNMTRVILKSVSTQSPGTILINGTTLITPSSISGTGFTLIGSTIFFISGISGVDLQIDFAENSSTTLKVTILGAMRLVELQIYETGYKSSGHIRRLPRRSAAAVYRSARGRPHSRRCYW